MTRLVTLTLITASAVDAKSAAAAWENAVTSNAANAQRAEALLPNAFAAARASGGEAVEVTSLFNTSGNNSPLYNIVHRAIGIAVFRCTMIGKRSVWESIKPLALVNCEQKGKTVTGTPSSTATEGARLFLIPAAK